MNPAATIQGDAQVKNIVKNQPKVPCKEICRRIVAGGAIVTGVAATVSIVACTILLLTTPTLLGILAVKVIILTGAALLAVSAITALALILTGEKKAQKLPPIPAGAREINQEIKVENEQLKKELEAQKKEQEAHAMELEALKKEKEALAEELKAAKLEKGQVAPGDGQKLAEKEKQIAQLEAKIKELELQVGEKEKEKNGLQLQIEAGADRLVNAEKEKQGMIAQFQKYHLDQIQNKNLENLKLEQDLRAAQGNFEAANGVAEEEKRKLGVSNLRLAEVEKQLNAALADLNLSQEATRNAQNENQNLRDNLQTEINQKATLLENNNNLRIDLNKYIEQAANNVS